MVLQLLKNNFKAMKINMLSNERKSAGEHVDSKNIRKHKNDVFRLAQLLTADTRQSLSPEIAEDMKSFLAAMESEDIDLKSISVRGTDKKTIMSMMYRCYGLI